MSDLIRATRVRAGVTGAQLAERLGVTAGAVSQMEQSERRGTIQLDTLRRALAALGRDVRIDTAPSSPYAPFAPSNVTDEINRALDGGEPELALRLLTHAASTIAESPERFSAETLEWRPTEVGDPRWEQLFRAVMGAAIPADRMKPTWATTQRLPRAWYPFGHYPSLKARAKASTPADLRALNIMLDERSLARAGDGLRGEASAARFEA